MRSPTYTLVELYPLHGLTVVHADLYRLRDPAELETLGLRDWAQPGHLWLIEWPERAAGHLPAPDLSLPLTIGAAGACASSSPHTPISGRPGCGPRVAEAVRPRRAAPLPVRLEMHPPNS